MPRFDGTGPQGQGLMTGRGEGYCAVRLPGPGQPSSGYAGLQGAPVYWGAAVAPPAVGARFAGRPRLGRAFRRGRGRGGGRGRRFSGRGW
jgi:hypothetical protein